MGFIDDADSQERIPASHGLSGEAERFIKVRGLKRDKTGRDGASVGLSGVNGISLPSEVLFSHGAVSGVGKA